MLFKGMIYLKSIEIRNLNIKINQGELISIIGPNGSGKTYILKMICNKIKNNNIYIDNKNINSYSINYKKNNIVCVFDDNMYNTSNPKNELMFYLKKLNINIDEIIERIKDFNIYFELEKILNENFFNMSIQDRVYIKILSLLIIKPKVFCIDDLLTYLNNERKTKVLNYIKERNITLLSITSNMEELLLFDKCLIINKGKNVLYNKTETVLKESKIFEELGLSLPFIYDLNNLLNSYELISDIYITQKELVDILWK